MRNSPLPAPAPLSRTPQPSLCRRPTGIPSLAVLCLFTLCLPPHVKFGAVVDLGCAGILLRLGAAGTASRMGAWWAWEITAGLAGHVGGVPLAAHVSSTQTCTYTPLVICSLLALLVGWSNFRL